MLLGLVELSGVEERDGCLFAGVEVVLLPLGLVTHLWTEIDKNNELGNHRCCMRESTTMKSNQINKPYKIY